MRYAGELRFSLFEILSCLGGCRVRLDEVEQVRDRFKGIVDFVCNRARQPTDDGELLRLLQ